MPVGKKSIARLSKTAKELNEPKATGIRVEAPEVPKGDAAPQAAAPKRRTASSTAKKAADRAKAPKAPAASAEKAAAVKAEGTAAVSSYSVGNELPYWLL